MNELAHLQKLDKIYNHLKKGVFIIPFEGMDRDLGINPPELRQLLKRLVDDKLVLWTKNEVGEGYSINAAYLDFDGYVYRYQKQKEADSLMHSKNWYETANAERVYDNYKSTRWMAIIALLISIAGLIVAIVSLRR